MPIFRPGADAYCKVVEGRKKVVVIKAKEFEKFNSSVLGLGDIRRESSAQDVVVAVLDLQGFTNFCKQVDPQLSVPLYLHEFLEWVFTSVRSAAIYKCFAKGFRLYHGLPFFAKFQGDGLMFLWETVGMSVIQQHNILVSLNHMCENYRLYLLERLKFKFCEPPTGLRCGVARGTVFSVGDGNDFVGPCINLAARLQNLDGATFAFSRCGFNPEGVWTGKASGHMENWILRKVAIKGMGESELVYLRKEEFEAMSEEDKGKYRVP
ncbi:MAG: hypothetical protein NTY65_07670 [Planctomycetota bacterium]|nr:hypothetical protein [Planctomycetota bacterium]